MYYSGGEQEKELGANLKEEEEDEEKVKMKDEMEDKKEENVEQMERINPVHMFGNQLASIRRPNVKLLNGNIQIFKYALLCEIDMEKNVVKLRNHIPDFPESAENVFWNKEYLCRVRQWKV